MKLVININGSFLFVYRKQDVSKKNTAIAVTLSSTLIPLRSIGPGTVQNWPIDSVLFIFDSALQHNEKKKQRQHFFHSFFNGFVLTELQKVAKL